jgi:hypothetical protein
MYLIVTIDTEEDNWGEYDRASFTVKNISRIPRLQDLFARNGVRPTYLVSYPVVTDPQSVDILGGYHAAGQCEIGTHPHPWNTPPVVEERNQLNSYICNLPPRLQHQKIETLTNTIAAAFGRRPTSYRSGKWGFDESVAKNLIALDYKVDSSMFPAWDWSPGGGPNFSRELHDPFTFVEGSGRRDGQSLIELPPTVAFLQGQPALATSTYHSLKRLPLGNKMIGGLGRLGLLNHICVSPEINPASDMIRLSKALLDRGTKVINMFFHSPSLLEGCTPFVKTPADVERFIASIDTFLEFASEAGLRSVTLSELSAQDLGVSATRALGNMESAVS